VQNCQPEVVIGVALCAEIERQGFAQALQGVGAWVDLAAFDALDGAGADFTLIPRSGWFILYSFRI
jgi:hypothetical protein